MKEGPKALFEYIVGVVPEIVAVRGLPLEHEMEIIFFINFVFGCPFCDIFENLLS